MTEHENEHVAWIREKMDDLHQRGLMPGTDTVDEVIRRAKDLARQLAAAEAERDAERARCQRLQGAVRSLGALADWHAKHRSKHYPSALGEDAQSEMGLLPGDLTDGSDDLLSRAAVIADVMEGDDDAE